MEIQFGVLILNFKPSRSELTGFWKKQTCKQILFPKRIRSIVILSYTQTLKCPTILCRLALSTRKCSVPFENRTKNFCKRAIAINGTYSLPPRKTSYEFADGGNILDVILASRQSRLFVAAMLVGQRRFTPGNVRINP